jgi:hypothetical protein
MAVKRFIPVAAALFFAGNAVDALRFGYADWLFRQGRLEEAVETNPGNALYHSDPAEAARRSPHDARLRMKLGLALEEEGHIVAAEKALLEAAELSRQYEPRWTLAGFYYRLNRTDAFWFWAREALKVAYDDPDPLFDLAWSLDPNGALLRQRLQPEARPANWKAWVLYAARHGRLDEVEAVLDRVTGIDPEPIAQALVAGGRVRALTRFSGHHALDWQPVPQEGVAFTRGAEGGFQLNFTGSQPEQCDVATRLLADPAARTAWPIEGGINGLRWRQEPFGDGGIRVFLRYERPAGETRAVGKVRVAG